MTHSRLILKGFLLLIGLAFVGEVVVMAALDRLLPELSGPAERLVVGVLLAALVGALTWLTLVRPLLVSLRQERDRVRAERARLEQEMARHQLDTRLYRALEMADDEREALGVVSRALAEVVPDLPVQLLLADSSNAHLRPAVLPGLDAGAEGPAPLHGGCGVETPRACVATRRGLPVVFPDSRALDACPKLVGCAGAPKAAACVPVSIAGRAAGVLHVLTAADAPPTPEHVASLQVLGGQIGARFGVLRAMAASELAATTDPLTGLLNRRSLENRARELLEQGVAIAVVAGDLDHFKRLNDTFGHAAGDRALRVFASAMTGSVRPSDVVARLGGEEFVVLVPGAAVEGAVAVAERIRATLREAIGRASVPAFTASFGVAVGSAGERFEDLLKMADQALYDAKTSGRDRVVVAGEGQSSPRRAGDAELPAQATQELPSSPRRRIAPLHDADAG